MEAIFKLERLRLRSRVVGSGIVNAARIDAHMYEVDRTLLRENLKLTPAQRLEKFLSFSRFISELRRAGEKARGREVARKQQA
jgi:hypothetical protein